jgi:DnaJ-class molecular chaperone
MFPLSAGLNDTHSLSRKSRFGALASRLLVILRVTTTCETLQSADDPGIYVSSRSVAPARELSFESQVVSKQDYYEVLGVPRSASADEIRKAFKKLARKYHPDVKPPVPDAAKRFAELTEANEVLSDKEKRQKYDQYGHGFEGAGGSPFQGYGGQGGASFDLNDILGGMFGGGGGGQSPFGARRSAPRPQKGADVPVEITVPFHVAVSGGEHEITVRQGDRDERLNLKIPAGIENGRTMRLSGQGHPGSQGGPSGDVLVTVRIAPHPWFRRDGRNILLEVPITPSEAAVGAKVDVPTVSDGVVSMTVPAGTSSGSKLRLRGHGIRDSKTDTRGDQIVSIRIALPPDLSDESKQLYEQLSQLDQYNPRAARWQQ